MRVITKKAAPTQPVVQPPPEPQVQEAPEAPSGYVILPGDNLSRVAIYNKTSLLELLKANPQIKNPNLVRPGDQIALPLKALPKVRPTSHIVKPGDSLSVIAKQNGMSMDEILRANPHIKNANLIKPGDNLKLPDMNPRLRSFSEILAIEQDLNNTRSNTDLIHHHYIKNNLNNNYIIDDKKNNRTGIYNKGKLVKQYKSIHGKNAASDDLTVTHTDERGNLIEMAGNMSTPAGYYQSRFSRKYHGAPSYVRYQPWMVDKGYIDGIPSSIHARTIREHANTNGCTGIGCEDLKDMDKILGRKDYVDTYILPVEEGNRFFLRNGVILFKSNDPSVTPAHNTIVKTPIEKFEYKTPDNVTDEQKDVVKKYTDSLITNKEKLQTDLGINNDTYIKLSKLAYGILGTESTFGNRNSALGNFLRAGNKARAKIFGGTASSPDIYSKFDTYKRNSDWESVGLTQMKFAVATKDSKVKALFDNYGITKESLVHDPAKAAVATLIHLSTLYKEAHENLDNTITRWNDGKGYAPQVKKYADAIEAYLVYKRGGKL